MSWGNEFVFIVVSSALLVLFAEPLMSIVAGIQRAIRPQR